MPIPTQEELDRIDHNLRVAIECVINEGGDLKTIADGLVGYGAELWKELRGREDTARSLYLLALNYAAGRSIVAENPQVQH